MIGEESVPLEVLSFFVGNNNPKKGLSPLIFRFLFRYLLQISEKGVPCANAMAEIIPNEPDTDHADGGIFLSVYFCFFPSKRLCGCSFSVVYDMV